MSPNPKRNFLSLKFSVHLCIILCRSGPLEGLGSIKKNKIPLRPSKGRQATNIYTKSEKSDLQLHSDLGLAWKANLYSQ
jgi:hypothetical protein